MQWNHACFLNSAFTPKNLVSLSIYMMEYIKIEPLFCCSHAAEHPLGSRYDDCRHTILSSPGVSADDPLSQCERQWRKSQAGWTRSKCYHSSWGLSVRVWPAGNFILEKGSLKMLTIIYSNEIWRNYSSNTWTIIWKLPQEQEGSSQ